MLLLTLVLVLIDSGVAVAFDLGVDLNFDLAVGVDLAWVLILVLVSPRPDFPTTSSTLDEPESSPTPSNLCPTQTPRC
jgi:hypothetical protein